jgi:putative ABC transport system ATP-binding protein
MNREAAFTIENVSKEYRMGEVSVMAVKEVSLKIPRGEVVVILGPSGSGKSTLLNILGGMDTPTSGKVYFGDKDISQFDESQLTMFRREHIGFIFQFYNLMPSLTAVENVELATEISRNPLNVRETLGQVGLDGKENNFPSQMSGGEQQRVAIARAIAKNPEVLMCDEPTGALDYKTGIQVLGVLKDINKRLEKTVIIITHNQPIADMADRVIKMRSGEIIEHFVNENPAPIDSIKW